MASAPTSATRKPRCSNPWNARWASRASSRRSLLASACTASRPRSATPRPSRWCPLDHPQRQPGVRGVRQAQQRRHQDLLGIRRRRTARQPRDPAGHALRGSCLELAGGVRGLLHVSYFYMHESCGQCTPCREGTGWLRRVVGCIHNSHGRPADIELLNSVADNIQGGTICALGDLAAMPVRAMRKHSRHDFEARIEHASGAVPPGSVR